MHLRNSAAALGLALSLAACRHAPSAPPVLPHESFTLESKILHETRRINVWTPPGYASGEARFPILYMPDGGIEEDFPHVIRTVDEAIRAGEMRPVIVVGIENTERRRDMTGPTTVEEDKKIAPHVGGSANFRAFVRDELMPAMKTRVRGNGETGIIGESLAGLFIVETFLEEPGMFDHYIELSPSLWWNDEALSKAAAEKLRSMPARPMTLEIRTASDDGIEKPIERLTAALKENAPATLTWHHERMPAEHHSTIYLAAAPGVLRKAFPPLPAK